jgi:hypothetical protein
MESLGDEGHRGRFDNQYKRKGKISMKRISTIVGLCLIAVVAFSAIGAATASATPPTLLLKLTSGTFPAEFTSKSPTSNVATLTTANGNTVKCTKVDNEGTLENAHLGKVTILFLECSTTILGHTGPCGNVPTMPKMITLANAVFHLGSTLKEKGVEGSAVPGVLVLIPGGTFSFKCTEIPIITETTITVTGEGIAGLLQTTSGGTPKVKEKLPAGNLVYEEGAKTGEQKYTEFLLPLESNKLMTGLQLKSENSFEKKLENSAQASVDTLEKFTNSEGKATEVELEEG